MAAAGHRGRRHKARTHTVETEPDALDIAKTSTDIDEVAASLAAEDAKVRLAALKRICPCKLRAEAGKEDMATMWDALFELVHDPDTAIRSRVLHTICDGSPSALEERVAEALEVFNRDPDRDIRRQAHKVLSSYTRTGKWNIL
jgi:hypothetical protein